MSRITRARQVLPLPLMLRRIGLGVHADKNVVCPFCQKKKFGVFENKGHWFFKCFGSECVANDPIGGHSEIGFLILHRRCSEEDAKDEFLRLATELDASLADDKLYPQAKAASLFQPAVAVEPQTPWHDLWQRLPLIADHKAALRKKRGFTDATIEALGFRSSVAANREFAVPLMEKWTAPPLIECGLLQADKSETKLNPQLTGLGLTEKKNADGENSMGWTNPVIIPYLDEDGIPFYLRPHKGGLKRQHRDKWFKEQKGGSVYCPYLLASLVAENNGVCIVTEGEFKAAALWQCRIPAVAIPGIQFTRARAGDISAPEYRFRAELVEMLKKFGVTDVIVAFDNEIKDDSSLPSYKPDPWDRYDTIVWAEYLAIDLKNDFESIRLGHIPDAWRIDGKADFDSALAGFIHGAQSGKEKHPAFNFAHGEKEGTRLARKAFLAIIADAQEKKGYHDLFASPARRIIECKIERLFYKPQVPHGGDYEEKLAIRFKEPNPLNQGKPIDAELADAFKSIHGCYYKRGTVDAKIVKAMHKEIKVIEASIEAEEGQAQKNIEHLIALRSMKAALWERIKGIPKSLSDFTLVCEYKLHTGDDQTFRLVRIRNKQGKINEEKLLRLDADSMCCARNFRKWFYNTSYGVPKFGEKELQLFVEDMDHHSAFRDIYQVNVYGLHFPSGLWFNADCAVAPPAAGSPPGTIGTIIKTDSEGIIWYEGIGYQVEIPISDDDYSTNFEQGGPKLLSPNGHASKLEISDKELMEHMADDWLEFVGGYDSWAALGLFFASACSPEMLALYNGQPGVFFHGNLSEGKTTTMRLLMRIHGFKHLDGLSIEPTTEVAMARALSHYSCLLVWFDEFRAQNLKDRPGKLTIIRDSFNRGSAAKGVASDPRKTRMVRPNTTACVTGESSTSDSATRSRFCIINISKQRRGSRSDECWARANLEAPHYYRLWQYILLNRTTFTALTMSILAAQMEKQKLTIPNERIRFVHMAAYAAFAALATLLETSLADKSSAVDRLECFETAIVAHSIRALKDVTEETNLNTFWRHVISGVQTLDIKSHFFKLKVMTPDGNGSLRSCTDKELKDDSVSKISTCCINFNPIYDQCTIYLRKQGRDMPLGAIDIKRAITTERWYLKTKTENFKNQGTIRAMIISLEPDAGFPFIEEFENFPQEIPNTAEEQ